jgi:acylphosphatase
VKIAKKYIIKGRVQGVGFRYFTNHIANRIGVLGYVKNQWDGSVEVYAIGSEQQLSILKTGLSKGPSYSHVEKIIEEDVTLNSNYYTFDIRF